MADPRGGLGSFARNGNGAARTYGAGIRPPTRDPGSGRAAGGVGPRTRTGVVSVAGGRAAATGSTGAGSAAAGSAAPVAAGGAAAGGETASGDDDPDPDPDPNAAAVPADSDPDDSADAGSGGARLPGSGGPGSGGPGSGGAGSGGAGLAGSGGPGSGGLASGVGRVRCAVRRSVLLGLAASGAALLAGCGGDSAGDQPSRAGQAGQAGTSASPGGSPSTEPSLDPFPGADDGGNGNATGLVRTDEVPVGGAVLVGDHLIAQPQRGVFKAFDATCPHQGITVDPPIGSNDYFMCPGHNSKFRLSDGGKISGPAPRGLRQVAVKVKDGYVVEA
jgi:Rieske Fe-S protein